MEESQEIYPRIQMSKNVEFCDEKCEKIGKKA